MFFISTWMRIKSGMCSVVIDASNKIDIEYFFTMKTEANISTFKGYYFLSRCLSLCVFFRITLIFWQLTFRFLPQKACILFFYQIVALHGKRKGSLKHMYKNIYRKQKSLPFDLYFFYKKWSKILQIF